MRQRSLAGYTHLGSRGSVTANDGARQSTVNAGVDPGGRKGGLVGDDALALKKGATRRRVVDIKVIVALDRMDRHGEGLVANHQAVRPVLPLHHPRV